VQEGCKKILVSDYFNLHEKLVSMQQRGISIDGESSKSDSLVSGYTHFTKAFSVTWYIALALNFQLRYKFIVAKKVTC
jgi:hypothetical protein